VALEKYEKKHFITMRKCKKKEAIAVFKQKVIFLLP